MEATIKTFGLPQPDYVVVKWETEAKTMGKMSQWLIRCMGSLASGKKILAGYRGKKNIIVTHGDTITTWWAALLGRLNRTRVMHIEAGMRSGKLFDPFPEEINRIITGWLSHIHICPDQQSADNLKRYTGEKVNLTLNTQADTIAFGLSHCENDPYVLPENKYVVASLHRYENIFNKDRFTHIISLLELIAKEFTLCVVMHPATVIQIDKLNLRKRLEDNPNIELIPRLEYLPFIKLIDHSEFVVTDGGGNQEELYFMGKPTLLFRYATERPDHIGYTTELSELKESIVQSFMDNYQDYQQERKQIDFSPSEKIVDRLEPFSRLGSS